MPTADGRPVAAAWGVGVDSTAMLIEMVEAGQPPDVVLTADTGGERAETYAFRPLFTQWLEDRGVPVHIVRNVVAKPLNWPPYHDLETNCLTNGTLPSIAFGRGGCSVKWKVAPQDAWVDTWPPAIAAWARGERVVKLIGYDAGVRDARRYAQQQGRDDPKYEYRYPLRVLGWDRDACAARIAAAGLPVPPKSACWFCSTMRPDELSALPPPLLRRIVAMEARAVPRLTAIDGLWRRPVKGMRGATPRPGSMTQYIRDQALLPGDEINAIAAAMPPELVRPDPNGGPAGDEATKAAWATAMDVLRGADMAAPGTPAPYGRLT